MDMFCTIYKNANSHTTDFSSSFNCDMSIQNNRHLWATSSGSHSSNQYLLNLSPTAAHAGSNLPKELSQQQTPIAPVTKQKCSNSKHKFNPNSNGNGNGILHCSSNMNHTHYFTNPLLQAVMFGPRRHLRKKNRKQPELALWLFRASGTMLPTAPFHNNAATLHNRYKHHLRSKSHSAFFRIFFGIVWVVLA